MFVCNMKLNSKVIFRIIFSVLGILILIMLGIGCVRVFKNKNANAEGNKQEKVTAISANNFTNVLKTVHGNLDSYVGTKIKFTGFVYRLYDFSDEQFVLAREMIVSTDLQAVIVGFLCHLNNADKYKTGCWVEIEGTITKGDYHGTIPVIEIEKITETSIPSEEYVYPPSEGYVATTNLL